MLNRLKKRDYNTKPTAVGKSLSSDGRFYTSCWNLWAECWHRKASLNQIILFLWRHKSPGLYPCVVTTWGGCDQKSLYPKRFCDIWARGPSSCTWMWPRWQRWPEKQISPIRAGDPLSSCAAAWALQQCETCACWKPWQPEIYLKNKEVLGFWQRYSSFCKVWVCCLPVSLIKRGPDPASAQLQSSNSVLTRLQEEVVSAGIQR